MADAKPPGMIRRTLHWLFSPSARWSVFALVVAGLVIGAGSVIGTQVALAVTGTDEFCGNTCHSHEKFVYPEHKLSPHYASRTGVRAMCVDCHVPQHRRLAGAQRHRRRQRGRRAALPDRDHPPR